jgi:hypothetical protein
MSVFRESLVFFDHIGLYDVVLPFLLIFTIVFGVLEKSRIFGTEADKKTTRKNLNAMVAFCIGFFVVASAQLVALINQFVANTALVLVIFIMLLILLGSLKAQQGPEGFDFLKEYKWLFWVAIIAIMLIFLNGMGWLGPAWLYVVNNWNSQLMATIFLFGIVALFIHWVTGGKEDSDSKSKD